MRSVSIVVLAAAAFYAVAVGLASYVGWLAAGVVGATITVTAAAAAAVWVVVGSRA